MDFETIKTRLADSAAISDIECACERERIDDTWWYDTNDPWEDTPAAEIREAVFYLEIRGLTERHPENPGWVRFLSPDEASAQEAT